MSAEVKVSHDRVLLLPVSIYAAIPLLQPVRVERQFKVDQMMTAIVEIQTFSGGVGTDEDQVGLCSEAIGDNTTISIVIVTGHRHETGHSFGFKEAG